MTAEMDLFAWTPPACRHSDPETSRLAAERAAFRANDGHRLVLLNLALRPMTDFELAAETGWQQTSIGKRRGECRDQGLVEQHTEDGRAVKRLSPSGSPALVWRLTAAGRAEVGQSHGQ